MSTINGLQCVVRSLMIPPTGGWLGDVTLLAGGVPSSGACTIQIGDLAIVGRILPDRGGLDAPEQPHVVVAGGAGWLTPLPAPGGSYASPSGVRLATVLADLARIAGELYNAPSDVMIGKAYGWPASTTRRPLRARAVLADLVARGAIPTWRIDPATGRTRFDAWPSLGAADKHGVISDRGLDRGRRTVQLAQAVAAWLPGATVQGATIRRTLLVETEADLRAEVYDA